VIVRRGEIYTARLDPTEGSEMKKIRPVLIVSNDIDKEQVDEGLRLALGLV